MIMKNGSLILYYFFIMGMVMFLMFSPHKGYLIYWTQEGQLCSYFISFNYLKILLIFLPLLGWRAFWSGCSLFLSLFILWGFLNMNSENFLEYVSESMMFLFPFLNLAILAHFDSFSQDMSDFNSQKESKLSHIFFSGKGEGSSMAGSSQDDPSSSKKMKMSSSSTFVPAPSVPISITGETLERNPKNYKEFTKEFFLKKKDVFLSADHSLTWNYYNFRKVTGCFTSYPSRGLLSFNPKFINALEEKLKQEYWFSISLKEGFSKELPNGLPRKSEMSLTELETLLKLHISTQPGCIRSATPMSDHYYYIELKSGEIKKVPMTNFTNNSHPKGVELLYDLNSLVAKK